VGEACRFLLERDGSRVIAGGTDILVEKNPLVQSLIDITKLNLNYIELGDETVRIGACTSFRRIEKDPALRSQCYSLVEAAKTIGDVSIRNQATVGGNICNAVPSADSPPPLMVCDSKVKIASHKGERIIRLEDFFLDVRKTQLNKGELVTEFQIPRSRPGTGECFLKLVRSTHDIAIVNVATRITLGRAREIEDVRITLGAVAPVPLSVRKAEVEVMNGGYEAITEAASKAADESKPISDLRASADYRKDMCKVLTKRALRIAFERAEAN
jgi:carbon-monoxide dehydrogenase medium subunit